MGRCLAARALTGQAADLSALGVLAPNTMPCRSYSRHVEVEVEIWVEKRRLFDLARPSIIDGQAFFNAPGPMIAASGLCMS